MAALAVTNTRSRGHCRWARARLCSCLVLRPLGALMDYRFEDSDHEADDRRTSALIGLVIVLALALAGVVLIRDLGKEARLEDCLMAGRTNCVPIDLPLDR